MLQTAISMLLNTTLHILPLKFNTTECYNTSLQ
jgi:hypothetical protein